MFQSQSDRRPKLPRFDFRFGFRLLRLQPPGECYRSKVASGAALAQAYGVVTGELRKGAGLCAGWRLLSSVQVVARLEPANFVSCGWRVATAGFPFGTNEMGTVSRGVNMRIINVLCCFLGGSLAVLLCAPTANPDRHVKAALAPLDTIAALAHSDASLATPELRVALADSDGATPADPVIKVPLVEPEVSVS